INKKANFRLIFGKESHYDDKGFKKTHKREAELDYHILTYKNKKRQKETHHFKTFRDMTYDFERESYLLINRSIEGRTLIPETANFDAFLIIRHFVDEEDLEALLKGLNEVDDIVLAKKIDPK